MAAPSSTQLIVPSGSTITIIGRGADGAVYARLDGPPPVRGFFCRGTLAEIVRLVNAAEIDGKGPPAPKSAWEALSPLLRG